MDLATRTAPAPRPLGFAVLVRRGEGLGPRLAGVRVLEAGPGEEAARLRELLADADLGVLAVEEDVLAHVPADERAHRERPLPVVIPFSPPRRWSDAGRGQAYLAALIRRAVGYHVKLEVQR